MNEETQEPVGYGQGSIPTSYSDNAELRAKQEAAEAKIETIVVRRELQEIIDKQRERLSRQEVSITEMSVEINTLRWVIDRMARR